MKFSPHKRALICFIIIHTISFLRTYACDPTKVIAHRGVSSLAPENTLPAFQLGIDLGVDFIELDVQKSSDDSLMVIHDATVDGTTSYSGLVSSFTYAELKTMDAGSWFSSEFLGTEIPTLYEVLALLRGKAKICVELKASAIETQAITLIENMGLENDVVVESFDYSQLVLVRQQNPNIAICYLSSILTQTVIDQAIALNVEIIGAGNNPNIWLIKTAQQNGIEVWNYTINTGKTILQRMSKGLDGIFTDNPQDMIGIKTFIRNGGLLAHWKFDEVSDTTILDHSSNQNNLSSNTINFVNGPLNTAIAFDGINQSISIPTSNSLNCTSDMISITAWIKLNQLPSQISGTFGPIYDSDQDSYILYLDKSNQELRFKITDDLGLTARPGIPENLLTTNTWMHIAGVYNGTDAFIYLNGQLIDVVTTTGIGNLEPNQQAYFGFNNGNFFNGNIDDFRIYERPLTPYEIYSFFSFTNPDCEVANEQILIPYTEIAENALADTIACPPYPIQTTYSEYNAILEFNGMSYINLNSIVKDITNQGHSLFAWIKTSNPSGDERIFSVNDRLGDNRFLFGIYNGIINIYTDNNYYSGLTNISDNQWHFIGYTWNNQTQQLKFFVDGNIELAYTLDLNIASTDRISLGQEFDAYQCSNYYNGYLSELSIWNLEIPMLSAVELMSNAPTINESLIGYYKGHAVCSGDLMDLSNFSNHGVSCQIAKSHFEELPNYNSNQLVTWQTTNNGNQTISSSHEIDILLYDSSFVQYSAVDGNIIFTDSVLLDVFNVPSITGMEDTVICSGESLIIDPGSFASYVWSDGSTVSPYVFSSSTIGLNTLDLTASTNDNCTAFASMNIDIQDCAEISEIENSFSVYPNPSTGFFQFTSANQPFILVDPLGRKIFYEKVGNKTYFTRYKGLANLYSEANGFSNTKIVFK